MAVRGQNQGKGKNKLTYASKPKIPPPPKREDPAKDSIYHECGETGHWKRNCPQYLAELLKIKKLSLGASNSGIFTIELNTFLNISWIYDIGCGTYICNTTQGLRASRKLKSGALSLYVGNGQREAVVAIGVFHLFSRNNMVYFSAIPRDGIFEIDLSNSYANDSSMYVVSNKRAKLDLDSALLWHCRLRHISKKRIEKLHMMDFLIQLTLALLKNTSIIMPRQRAIYFVTFTYDFSRYGYVYLLKHKHEVFETFKVFQKEVENQLGKTIKSLRSDRGGEHMSQEFLDHLRDHWIITHRTPPYTPQHNGVSERRNITLLDMVRSMMSQTTLPKSFWDYALETAARILNMVPTKKVEKTPYKVWHGQAPKLSYLKVWGCEALVKRDTLTKPDKLKPSSIKCIFIGYPKEMMGYSFYYPPENKVFVAQNAEFLENSLITQEASGSLEYLEIIQEEEMHPSIDTSLNHKEDDLEIDEPQRDLGEPANYKAALLDPESDKWLNAMNVEMQSMKGNEVWDLVDLPLNDKTVGSKWLFKKKADMDGAVHTYKAHFVAKGFIQTYGVNYEETFSPIADIRAIRILIAITTCFAMKDLGEAAYILGIKIYRDRSWQLIDKLRLGKSQGASTPAELKRMQNVPYTSVVGSIMYVVRCTRPDVAFAHNITSRFQQNPGDLHWTTVKNILKYLKNTKDMLLVYRGGIDWKSAKQSIFATSSAESEYIAAYDASKEAVWVRKFISGLGVIPTVEEP
ncbi:retrotransposon protein, putative, ty1-copia subclass, partial [Tanacetum coccineum]